MIDSPAVGGRVPVRLLLPPRFEERPEQQWPVLYLLHGCCDTYVSWTRSPDIERLSAQLDALVVMPDGGQVGFYSDWLDGPGWETFHTSELPQLLASEYRANGRAAIAGVSMGGVGALGYAARHPGQYAVAASFSGTVHTRLPPDVARATSALFSPTTPIPSDCGATPTSNLTSGSAKTRTTSPRSWAGPGCTSPPATASLVRSP